MIVRLWQAILHRTWLADSLFGLALHGTIALALTASDSDALDDATPVTYAWITLGILPIALRRWRTYWAIALLAPYNAATILAPDHWQLGETGIPLLTITYTVASSLPLRRAVTITAALWIPITLLELRDASQPHPAHPDQLTVPYLLLVDAVGYLVLLLIGRVVWNRRAYATALHERALAAEANQQALAAKAVAEERRRIARELHDVVAHHISVMGVLASGARRTLANDPAAAHEALATIEHTGRAVLREMRRLLNLLRADDLDPAEQPGPQPGLAAITDLVNQVRDAGLTVTYTLDETLGELDSGIAVTAYRITQEALTNILKHANAPTAQVRITRTAATLTLEISDTGRGPRPDQTQSGFGLIGMRERVALYSGTLRAGPRPGGGFRVRVTLPLDPPEETAK